jgi:hypothetical protein
MLIFFFLFFLALLLIRILLILLVVLCGLDERDLKFKEVSIAREFQLNLLRRFVHKHRHVQKSSAHLLRVKVVVAFEHYLEATFFILERAVLVFVEVPYTH